MVGALRVPTINPGEPSNEYLPALRMTYLEQLASVSSQSNGQGLVRDLDHYMTIPQVRVLYESTDA